MPGWAAFAAAEPELAAAVQARFSIRKHNTLATLRRDGSPRISGIEVQFADGELYLGMMPDSCKLHDLRRDPRLALHSPTEDPPETHPAGWPGEAKSRVAPWRPATIASASTSVKWSSRT